MTRGRFQTLLLKLVYINALLMMGIATAWSNGEQAKWVLNNAPPTYIVQQGDTLWEISGKFLHDPWHWPELWRQNPTIQNPNLIYPGDRIVLSYENGAPRLDLVRLANQQGNRVIKLHPHVRSMPANTAIPTIPLNVIGPFLNDSRVVTAQQAEKCPKIIALDEDHIVVGTGDRIYVNRLSPKGADNVFAVFRPNKTYIDPRSHLPIGIEGLVLGKAQLEVPGHPARLMITRSFAEIKIGDHLINTAQEELDPYFSPKLPKGPAKGQIISVFGGLSQIGQYQILVVTGGKNSHREIGDVLDIYQTHKDLPSRLTFETDKSYHFPPLKIGRCVVFRVFDLVSYVLVMNATRPIYLLDEVRRP